MMLAGENGSAGRRACSRATLSAKNLTWTKPVSNPGLCGWRPATDRLKHERWPELYLNTQSVPRCKHFPSRLYKTVSQSVLYREIIAVCSQIHTKHKYIVWAERRNVEC